MGKKLTNTKSTITLALFVLILSLTIDNLYIQVIALSITGIYGLIFLKETSTDINNLRVKTFKLPKMLGFISISLFFTINCITYS